MARYNTVVSAGTANSSTTTIPAPGVGVFTEFTGSTSYAVTIPDPTLYLGSTQTFYNSSTGAVTLNTPGGQFFKGPGQSGSSTSYVLQSGNTTVLASDGQNYIVLVGSGGPVAATTLSASSTVTLSPANATVTISPTGSSGQVVISSPTANSSAGTMDNVIIGGTSAAAGTFTSLTSANVSTNVWTNNNTLQGTSASSGQSVLFKGGVGINGTLYTVGLQETSSIVYKENVEPITGALDLVTKLFGVTYDRKDNKVHEPGLIAEQVYEVIPDLVGLNADGKPESIRYTKLTAYLIEAVKTLKAEIDELKGKK
jgi:Chaperone of endosialidase